MRSKTSVQEDLPGSKEIAAASNSFALDMYRELAAGKENLFFSPWSLSLALAMTYEGARGRTAEEMRSVLHLSGDNKTRRRSFILLDQRINAIGLTHLAQCSNNKLVILGEESLGVKSIESGKMH